jgi:cell wall-associated NlpC family hydrolase
VVSRAALVAEARSWVGVPFRHQGRSREGVDCAGLLVVVARAVGLEAPDGADYPKRPDGAALRRVLAEHLVQRARIADARPGDVALIRGAPPAGRSRPCHLAWVGEDGRGRLTLIHAAAAGDPGTAGEGRVIEHGITGEWRARIVSVWTVPGVG